MANIKIGIDYQKSGSKGLLQELDQISKKLKEISGIKVENLPSMSSSMTSGLPGMPSKGSGTGTGNPLNAVNTYYKAHAEGNRTLATAIRTNYVSAIKEGRQELSATNQELKKQQEHYVNTTKHAERLSRTGLVSSAQAKEMRKSAADQLKIAQDHARVAEERLKTTKEEARQLVSVHHIARSAGGAARALANDALGMGPVQQFHGMGPIQEFHGMGPIHQKRGMGERLNDWFTSRGGRNPDGTWNDDARMSVMDKALVGARGVQSLSGVVGSAAGMSIGYNTMAERNAASIQQNTTARMIGDMMAGTMKTDYFLGLKGVREKAMPGGKWDAKEETQTKQLAEGVGHIAGAVGDLAVVAGSVLAMTGAGAPVGGAVALGGAAISGLARMHAANQAGNGAGGVGQNLVGAYDAYQRNKLGGAEAAQAAGIAEGLNAVQQANPWANQALDLLGAEAGWRTSASRVLEGQHNAMRWVGGGFTAAEAGEMAAAGKRRAGMRGMTGGGSRMVADPTIEAKRQELQAAKGQIRNYAKEALAAGIPATGPMLEAVAERNRLEADIASSEKVGKYNRAGGDMGRVSAYARLSNYGFDPGVSHSAFDAVWEGTNGGKKGGDVRGTYDLFSKAVALGTSKGFSEPRTQETLLNVMTKATEGRSDVDREGIQNLLYLFASGDLKKGESLTVRQAEARASGFGQMEDTLKNNQYYRDIGAMRLLGQGVDTQSAAIINDQSLSSLMTGDKELARLTGFSVKQQRSFGREKALDWLTSGSPVLAGQVARERSGESGAVDEDQVIKALRNKKGFTPDMAKQVSEIAKALISGEDMSDKAKKTFDKLTGDKIGEGSKLDSTAAKTIQIQEQFKAILTQEFAKELAKHMGESADVKKLAENIIKGKGLEETGENMDPRKGGDFVVRILHPYDGPKGPLPP